MTRYSTAVFAGPYIPESLYLCMSRIFLDRAVRNDVVFGSCIKHTKTVHTVIRYRSVRRKLSIRKLAQFPSF